MTTKFELNKQAYRYLFDNASDAMWIHDTTGIIRDANLATEKLTGYFRAELIGMSVVQLLCPESLEKARGIKQSLHKGETFAQPYEQRLTRKDGTVRIVQISSNKVLIKGEIRGYQHIARDISEERTAQAMLSEIVSGTPIPTFVINREHKVTHWNKALESISHMGAREMVGTDGQWQPFYPDKRPTMADLIVDGVSAKEIESFYSVTVERSGIIEGACRANGFYPALGENGIWLHFTASPIKNEKGQVIGAIETLEDITEEKQLQENTHRYVQLITQAQEEERKRISRELHDDMSPPLLLTIQRLDAAASQVSPRVSSPMKKGLEDLRNLALEALEGLRRCAQDLRPRILDDLGLIPALEWMAEALTKNFGIEAKIEIAGSERPLPAEMQLLLFRIVQEAFSNIRRHSGASNAVVRLEFTSNKVRLTVTDNGKGFWIPTQTESLAATGKLGIIGMKERAGLLDGKLRSTHT
jgi:PAS domain S-box-containing protein